MTAGLDSEQDQRGRDKPGPYLTDDTSSSTTASSIDHHTLRPAAATQPLPPRILPPAVTTAPPEPSPRPAPQASFTQPVSELVQSTPHYPYDPRMQPSFPAPIHPLPSSSLTGPPPPPSSLPYPFYPHPTYFHPATYPYPFYPLIPSYDPSLYPSHTLPSPYYLNPHPNPYPPPPEPPPAAASRKSRTRKTNPTSQREDDDSETSEDSDDEEEDDEGTHSRRQSQAPPPAPLPPHHLPPHQPPHVYPYAAYHPYYSTVPSYMPHPLYHQPFTTYPAQAYEQGQQEKLEGKVSGDDGGKDEKGQEGEGGEVYTIAPTPQSFYYQPSPVRPTVTIPADHPSPSASSPALSNYSHSTFSQSTNLQASPLSATSDLPNDDASPSYHLHSLPTYTSSTPHLHPPPTHSVDDFQLHLHSPLQSLPTHPRPYDDTASPHPHHSTPPQQHSEYTHYQGAKGRIFRVRDIPSSYTDGQSRKSSYQLNPPYYPPDSPHHYPTPLPPPPFPPPPVPSKKAKKHKKDEIHFADLRFGDKIGEGSFGEVFRGTLWGQEVAIKKLRIKGLDGDRATGINREFRKEVKIMRTLRHPNIVEFLGVCMEPPNLCLVTEFLSNGSLEDVLERMTVKEGKKFSLKRIISLAKDIARGLNWLHHKGIIHRDLKSANILLDQNGKGKICFPQDDHEVLTARGFMGFDDFRRALERGEAVSVACPVRRCRSDALDQLALEYHDVVGLDSLVDKSTVELIEMRQSEHAVNTNHMDLLLTPDHKLPVTLSASTDASNAPVQFITALQVVNAESQCAGFVCSAVHGVSDPTPHLPLPFAVELGLTTDDEVDAFVELYGYWLGEGSLTGLINAVQFNTDSDADCLYLDELFSRLPLSCLPLHRAADDNEDMAQKKGVYLIHDSTWVRYFAEQCDVISFTRLRATSTSSTSSPTPTSTLAATSTSSDEDEDGQVSWSDDDADFSSTKGEKNKELQFTEELLSDKRPWCWVWERLCARRLRLLLRGLSCANGDKADDVLSLTSGSIYTASHRCCEDYQHIALRAGFTCTASLMPCVGHSKPQWHVAYKAGADKERLVINPSDGHAGEQLRHKEINLLRLVTSIKVWCIEVPTADHLIIVRRVKRDDTGAVVAASRPTVVSNCDFGLSHVKKRVNMTGSYGQCGTPSYMAPEVLKKQSYGVKADVFSFGICLCELITGKYPYENEPESTTTFESAIVSGLRPSIPAYCPVSIRNLITSCWSDDPDARPSVDEIMDTLVATERQLLAAENLTILDELPEELAKLFEDQQAENAFLTMSMRQLKGQLDAAQARASEWEEKWEKEKTTREEMEKQVKAMRELAINERRDHAHQHAATQPMPQGATMMPVLMRGGTGQETAGSRRMSMTGLPLPIRLSTGGSGAPSPAPPPLHLPHGTSSGLISPHAAHRHLPAMSRSPFHSTASPRMSPSTTPSPTHAGHPSFHGATTQGGHMSSIMPPAGVLSPAQSAPSPSVSQHITSPTSALSPRGSTGSLSPSSASPRR